jgi:hypothetical protein
MKNVLIYYYNLHPINIHQINKNYKFKVNNGYYSLIEINKNINDIEKIYDLSIKLNQMGIYTHQIFLNLQNSIITNVNNTNYVLLKTYDKMDRTVTENDIITFSNLTKNVKYNELLKDNWYQLWMNKIDYFELQIDEFKNKYPLIKESFSFFSGLVENGIQLLINNKNYNKKICICHERIKKNSTLFDLYNPFNFIIDINIRDIVEYFKDIFLYEDPYPMIKEYIISNNLSNDELYLFFIRLLYPSFYFDLYEQIIQNNVNEEKIIEINKKSYDYQILIKKTYDLIRSICFLPEIEWLN